MKHESLFLNSTPLLYKHFVRSKKPRVLMLALSIAIALLSSGCGNGVDNHTLTGAVGITKQHPPQAAPKVSRAFQAEVTRLAAEGLHLKEAVEASLDQTAQHLAAVFERQEPKDLAAAFEFRIIESDGQTSKTIFRRPEFFCSFPTSEEMARLNATDINGDGLKEIIVQSSSGGNCWACNPTEIYQVKNHKAELIAAAPIIDVRDLNRDGIAELVVIDGRWESYEYLSHVACPSAMMVYQWKDGRYVYASRDFPAYYKDEIARLRASLDEAKSEITGDDPSDEAYVGLALSLAITYAHIGEIERGLQEMELLMNSNVRGRRQSASRKIIIEDFRKGASSAKLRGMKPGELMPLG